jgi:hypothetical protein
LTAFLRQAYFEKKGIYIQRARNEHELLKQFWKDEISDAYRNQRNEDAQMRKTLDPHQGSLTFGGAAAVPVPKKVKTKFDI